METDLNRIKQLAKKREEENWRFRTQLKMTPLSESKIDALVKDLYTTVAARIDCTACGNCCKELQQSLTNADIERLAKHLGLSDKQFRAEFIKSEENGVKRFKTVPCPLLTENRCSVYDCRPRECRSYPHLHKKEFTSRLIQVLASYDVCPIVFNVYEGLKQALSAGGR